MADPLYGLDYSVLAGPQGNDLDGTFAELRDEQQVLLEDVYKRVTTPEGSLFWAPTGTLDLRDHLNAVTSTAERAELARRIEGLFDEDPRMDVAAAVTYQAAERVLLVEITITPAVGSTFRLVLTVDSSDVRVEQEE